jgi:membrane protease YdiL (CAAX protease family)
LITTLVDPTSGMMVHAGLLIGLLVYSAGVGDAAAQRLALALALAPMTRLVSLMLPLAQFPQATWYPLVSIPLLLATAQAARQLGLRPRAIGLCLGAWPRQVLFIGCGLGIGALEYAILRPPIRPGSDGDWLLLAASLVLFTGCSEELIFRGLLQTVTGQALRRGGLLYGAVLFGVLHIGYRSLLDVLFVITIGLFFGYVVRWGGSLLGVALAHGMANITLFLLMPALVAAPASFAIWGAGLIGGGTALGLLAAGGLWYQGRAQLPSQEPALAAHERMTAQPSEDALRPAALAVLPADPATPGPLPLPPWPAWQAELRRQLLADHYTTHARPTPEG